jgi:3-dehydro-L-gulonate 2-dehydrogenase
VGPLWHLTLTPPIQLTDDPAAIMESELPLPMGYWKGSGLAVLIDLLVSILSGGLTTTEIGEHEEEQGLSQLFLAFDLRQLTDADDRAQTIRAVTGSLLSAVAMEAGGQVYYPGQRTWLRRQENERHGVPVDQGTWSLIKSALE